MSHTYETNLTDADETEVEVEYDISYDGNGWDEPRTVEVEILSVTWFGEGSGPKGDEVALLDSEHAAIIDRIAETHEPDDGGDQAYEDWRDRDD